MKFLQYWDDNKIRLAILQANHMIPLAKLGMSLPGDMKSLIRSGDAILKTLESALHNYKGVVMRTKDIAWTVPITNPGKFLCLGLNYVNHAKEGNNATTEHPTIFLRTPTSFSAHLQSLIVPRVSSKLDYEAELLVVIGKTAKYLTHENALDVVWGYSLFNDGSIRSHQNRTSQWALGKNFDQSGGFGPWIVTADELPPGGDGLDIQMRLNGHVMQSANTRDMLFDVRTTLVEITECMTLQPGDCISMGTPAGVGYARNPPVFMQPGDVAQVKIEGVGTLRNTIALETEVR